MIYSVTENGEITQNSIVDVKEHYVEEYYNIVPRHWTVDGFGTINSKKPIKVTENNSLMCYDEKEKQVVLKSISQYLEEPTRYYMIIRAPETNVNKTAEIETKYGKTVNVEFSYIMGFMLALYLKQLAGVENIITTGLIEMINAYKDEWSQWFNLKFDFYKKTYHSSLSSVELVNIKPDSPFKILADTVIMTGADGFKTVANEIFYSTNLKFNVGMLEALINSERYMVREISELLTHRNINPSVYTNILNTLFANYSITKAEYLKYPRDYMFSIKYDVSPLKFNYLRASTRKVKRRPYTRYLKADGSMVIDTWYQKERYEQTGCNETVDWLIKAKNDDKIKFIRFDELIVSHVRSDVPYPLYDIITGNGSATNYLLSCAPWAKNSDGDVLAVMALTTKEALKAGDLLMMSNAERLREGTSPDKIRNWIQKDAVVGLYQATKNV